MVNDAEKKLSNQEMVEAFVFPHELSVAEKADADAELKRLRMLRLMEMTDKQRLYADLLRLKYQMENYLRYGEHSESTDLGVFLGLYLKILGKKQKDFADEISLHYTKLSQLLSGKAEASLAILYRLEQHSGGLLPASLWWNIQAKKVEAEVKSNREGRLREAGKVKNALQFA